MSSSTSGVNARYLTRAHVPEPVDLITCDASFIGLATVLPAALALAAEKAELVALVKPQFEAGREHVGKGGVVRDPVIHRQVCERAAAWVAAQPGWTVVGVVESPILGPRGNREFVLYAQRRRPPRGGNAMTEPPVRFSGFRPAAFAFFSELRDNNDPAWFKPRKAVYETEVLGPFRELIAAVRAALHEAGLPLVGDPRHGIFRIYRDVRFSPDKRLYKTHAGAVLTRSGRKHDPGLLYIHFAPAESMVGAGFWHPESGLLARLRRAILDNPEEFLAIADGLAAAGSPLSSDERLSRPPRGFEAAKGTKVEGYVGWKSFTAHAPIERCRSAVACRGRPHRRLRADRLPLLEWGWAVVDGETPVVVPIRTPARPLPKPDF